jgi:hypothetical protein
MGFIVSLGNQYHAVLVSYCVETISFEQNLMHRSDLAAGLSFPAAHRSARVLGSSRPLGSPGDRQGGGQLNFSPAALAKAACVELAK